MTTLLRRSASMIAFGAALLASQAQAAQKTDQTGAVVIETRGDALEVQTARSMRPRYWSSALEVEALATAADGIDALP